MKKILKVMWRILGVIYLPVYIAFRLLRGIARLMLALSYLGMLEGGIAKDIFKSLFKWHGKY